MKNIPYELYGQILKVIPIACVDMIVSNSKNEILLLKRKNKLAKNEWWFPGGRIHFMETRKTAVARKLKEECGLKGVIKKELGTYDLILGKSTRYPSHAITTVFHLKVDNDNVCLDSQSNEYKWKHRNDWLKITKSPFVRMILLNSNYASASK